LNAKHLSLLAIFQLFHDDLVLGRGIQRWYDTELY